MSDGTTAPGTPSPQAGPPKTRMPRRILIATGIVLGVLAVAGCLLYSFGTMQPPSAEVRAAYDASVAAGRQVAVPARFGIPVPGCVCHSDDPALQVPHSTRYIRECKNCHVR